MQAWAQETVPIRKYAKSSGGSADKPRLYLMPYESAKGVRFLGFYVLPVAVQEARRLRQHIKLALDLDETLVNAHENAALQVCTECTQCMFCPCDTWSFTRSSPAV